MFSNIKLTARVWAHRVFRTVEWDSDDWIVVTLMGIIVGFLDAFLILTAVAFGGVTLTVTLLGASAAITGSYAAIRVHTMRSSLPTRTTAGRSAAREYSWQYPQMDRATRKELARHILTADSRLNNLESAYSEVRESLNDAKAVEWSSPLVLAELQEAYDTLRGEVRHARVELEDCVLDTSNAIAARKAAIRADEQAQAAVEAVRVLAKARKALS